MRQVLVYRDPESDAWIAEVPSLPGCFSDGLTKEEAIQNASDAIECWIAGANAAGMTIPEELGSAELVNVPA
ncbi:MAG: type II toxin-antitoxin system HicB family antitoxin [Planctomycetaceae bacterium]|nr:type II toxin-antitoxin system HicB family antitoxin [Planctomycetaceae bacterium]MCB9949483.1 type II toxin-antitoxin system HicB family antitoxin [Planctomycetaceae bacterium]